MWPFKRGEKNLDNVPTEVQQYYQSEQRERMGVAWVLAAVSLVVTVGVVLGLFFGGRAIFRHFSHKNKPVATAPQAQPASSASTSTPSNPATNSSSANTSTTPSDTSKNVAGQPAAPSTTPSSNTTAITNTGPGDTAAVAFGVATVVGFGLYEMRLRRKLN